MKLNKQPAPEAFKPVTLEITFETAEELEVFRTMAWASRTIPLVLHQNSAAELAAFRSETKCDLLKNMLWHIHITLNQNP